MWGAFTRFVEEARERKIPVAELSGGDFLAVYARQAAWKMITMLRANGANTWREAARVGGKTEIIYRALSRELQGSVGVRVREMIEENAKLISSFPSDVAALVAARAAAHSFGGGRSSDLASYEPHLRRFAHSRAKLIARTQVSKASSELIEARSEALNLPWYQWETSGDQRVRVSHRKMQGVLFRFDTPPSPEHLAGEKDYGTYNAGATFNCRCYPAPVVTLNAIRFPAKVYWGGRISYMNKGQFERINTFQQEAA